ncbi:MAG TPA: hypothetical protein VMB19_08730 [Silvibacterium sp.]|nr:hypothetical protein [Silvibacterium sp.]
MILPSERKPAGTKEIGPRALALLQMGAKGKTSLVPIAIMVNGKFWDASEYKADPVPMALDSGTVYEVERSGSSQGLFTVSSALHSDAVNVLNPWIAIGQWLPAGSKPAKSELKAESVPVGIDTSDQPPRLTRNPEPASAGTPPAAKPPSGPSAPSSVPSSSSPSTKPSTTGTESTGSTRPTADQGKPSSTRSTTNTTPPSPPPPATAPKASETAPTPAKPKQVRDITPSDSGADEGDRPILRRGKPAESFADEDIPGYSKPGSPSKASAKSPSKPVEGPVELIPAISDAAGPEPRSFAFEWFNGEEAERRLQMTDLAKQALAGYLHTEAKDTIAPKAAGKPFHHSPAHKAAEPVFDNQHMAAYDLWTNNQPVIVFSADARMPATSGEASSSGLQYSITLVAYPDIYGNLHKLYAGVTDKYHLDVTPRLELIDAVDADGDGRGELLFRETSDAGTGWVIYRATADTLWKMYDSLNLE